MDFYKKLKASKSSSSHESISDILTNLERVFTDMQPTIQNHSADKSKIQKSLWEIRTQIEALGNSGGTVSVDQEERIKEINRHFKRITEKYGDVTNTPELPRRKKLQLEISKDPPQAPQNKVALVEVEEKLKSMRQKRLDRLSVFVAEQSKLSEERINKNNEVSEIEEAIKSIQKTEVGFKGPTGENSIRNNVIIEEDEVKHTAKVDRIRSNESDKFRNGKSSTLRFINKFNCTMPVNSSTEDLTKEIYNKPVNVPEAPTRQVDDADWNSKHHNLIHEDSTSTIHDGLDDSNPLLSPNGKQRRAIYLYDHECQFLEKEKRSSLPPLSTFGKDISPGNAVSKPELKSKIHTYENANIFVKNESASIGLQKNVPKAPNVGETRPKVSHIYENKEVIEAYIPNGSLIGSCELAKKDQDCTIHTNDVKESAEDLVKDNSNIPTEEDKGLDGGVTQMVINKQEKKDLPKLVIRNDLSSRRKLYRNDGVPMSPLRSPLPLPRRTNHAERVLKKMQRNWDSLHEILENDSDVDCDEIEDLRKTCREAEALLSEYKAKINKLDRKSREEANEEKLRDIKLQLKNIAEDIKTFRGLKRDSSYMQLSNRLSNYFLDVSKMNLVSEKQSVLDDINSCIKELEKKVVRNESMLMEILDMQVTSIGTNCLCITKV